MVGTTRAKDPGLAWPAEPSERVAGFSLPPAQIRRPEDEGLYMIRWSLARMFGFELKINLFMSSDPGCLHDHPWPFMSIMLAGRYTEVTERVARGHFILTEFDGIDTKSRWVAPGERYESRRVFRAPCVLFRRAAHRHRVEVDAPCLTLNISGKRSRNWGFWLKGKWIHWRDYLSGTHRC